MPKLTAVAAAAVRRSFARRRKPRGFIGDVAPKEACLAEAKGGKDRAGPSRRLARPPRFERGAPGLEGRCSIQLSYGRAPAVTGHCTTNRPPARRPLGSLGAGEVETAPHEPTGAASGPETGESPLDAARAVPQRVEGPYGAAAPHFLNGSSTRIAFPSMSFALTMMSVALAVRALKGTWSRSWKLVCAMPRFSPFSSLAMRVV